MTLAAHPHITGIKDGLVHAHLVLGGLSYGDMRKVCALWPGLYWWRKCWDKWGWLHYILSQDDRWQHARDGYYCHNLLCPPLESWNLEVILQRRRHKVFSAYGARSGAKRGKRFRRLRGQKAAAVRCDKVADE